MYPVWHRELNNLADLLHVSGSSLPSSQSRHTLQYMTSGRHSPLPHLNCPGGHLISAAKIWLKQRSSQFNKIKKRTMLHVVTWSKSSWGSSLQRLDFCFFIFLHQNWPLPRPKIHWGKWGTCLGKLSEMLPLCNTKSNHILLSGCSQKSSTAATLCCNHHHPGLNKSRVLGLHKLHLTTFPTEA